MKKSRDTHSSLNTIRKDNEKNRGKGIQFNNLLNIGRLSQTQDFFSFI